MNLCRTSAKAAVRGAQNMSAYRARLVALVLATSIGGAPEATAQSYPSRPITMVVPFAAGGPTDTLARILSERLSASLGQPLVIENIAGAAGSLGTRRVARSAPDGYTLIVGFLGTHVLNAAIYSLEYDVEKDFEPIAFLASNPVMIVAKKAAPAKDLKELIAWLRANPGKASQGTPGAGTPAHVAGAYFQRATRTDFQFVLYRGAAPAMQELVGGHIDLMFDQASNALPHVRDGHIKAYAVAARARLASAPDIPTVDEAGLPEFYVSVWSAMWAPKGTPEDVILKLNAAVVDALGDPAVARRLSDLGWEVPERAELTPAVLARYQRAEIAKWWPIVKAMNAQAR
jgi:tripartite-type tricarboxylate transporter receptor subunit TctC